MEAFHQAVSRNYLLENYETKLVYFFIQIIRKLFHFPFRYSSYRQCVSSFCKSCCLIFEKLKQFVTLKGLGEGFQEYLKSLAPKPLKQKLEEAKREVMKHI